MKSYIVAFIFLISSLDVVACGEPGWDWDYKKWIDESESIYFGHVVTLSATDEYINNSASTYKDDLLGRAKMARTVKVKVYETLKGNGGGVVEAKLHKGCSGGQVSFASIVILFKLKDFWHVKMIEVGYEDVIGLQVKNALTKL